MGEKVIDWIKAAAIRAVKTAAQAALGIIGASVALGGVDWVLCGSAAALAAVVSILTSVVGLPEVENGENVAELAKHAKN